MFAVVESGSITSMPKGNKGVKIGDYNYPPAAFTLWTEAERNAVGIYTVEIDNTNFKDNKWYTNTDIPYASDASSNKVKGTYGSATAKAHADTKWTQSEIDAGKAPSGADTNTVKTEGLKTKLIRNIKESAESILNKTDWYITRKTEEDIAIPSSITTHRKAVRTKQASMETAITNAADTPALETRYTYTEEEDGSSARPLGELPTLED